MYLYKSQREKEKSLRIRQFYFRRLSKDFTTVYFCKDYATMPTQKAMLRRDTVRITIPLQMKQYGGANHIVLDAMKIRKR